MPKQPIRRRRMARPNMARVVRKLRSQPVARVRSSTVIRSKGNSTATTNVLRNLKAAVRRIDKDGKVSSKWWFEALKTFGFTILKVLATELIASEVEKHLESYPLNIDHPLQGKLLSGASITGSIIRLCLGPEDLLADSDFVTIEDPGATWMKDVYGKARYRQAKVDWVKVVIQPTTGTAIREGTLLCCLRPITLTESEQDFAASGREEFTWEELQRAPGVISKSACTPTVLTYSPTPKDRAYDWLTIGTQTKDSSKYGVGGDIFLYLDIGYQNWTSADNSPNKEYSLDKVLFDVTIESRISLRSYEDEVYTRAFIPTTVEPNALGVSAWGRHIADVPLNEVYMHKGVFLYDAATAMELV